MGQLLSGTRYLWLKRTENLTPGQAQRRRQLLTSGLETVRAWQRLEALRRLAPEPAEEFEAMVRVGAFDEFGESRTRQFWQAQHLLKSCGGGVSAAQGWILPPPGLDAQPTIPLAEPTHLECLRAETELLGFAVSGHPLEL